MQPSTSLLFKINITSLISFLHLRLRSQVGSFPFSFYEISYEFHLYRVPFNFSGISFSSILLSELLCKEYNLQCSSLCNILQCIPLSLSFLLPPLWSTGHPWNALFHFNFLIVRQSIGLLAWGISPSQGRYLYKHRINVDKHSCLEWDSNPLSQHLSGRRNFMS
jgi:hypothetical protein